MPKKRTSKKANSKVTPIRARASIRKGGKKPGTLRSFFSLGSSPKENKNFNTSFVYGNLAVDIKSKTLGKNVNLEYKFASKNFNLSGELTLNEKLFAELQKNLYPIVNNIRRMAM